MAQNADQVARSMGFKDAAQMLAWQARQQQIQHATDSVMVRPKAQQPATPSHSFLDTIMQYLPLGVLQKAGKAMDGKR